jgi:hypothetical protein
MQGKDTVDYYFTDRLWIGSIKDVARKKLPVFASRKL